MYKILKILITLFIIINCNKADSLHSKCENNICDCKEGTHVAITGGGRKYCAPDSEKPCPQYAVRLSPTVCECKKGYEYIDDERTTCAKPSPAGWHVKATARASIDDAALKDYLDVYSERNGMTTMMAKATRSTTLPTTTTTEMPAPTTIKEEQADGVYCNRFYIWFGLVLIAVAALVLTIAICCIWMR